MTAGCLLNGSPWAGTLYHHANTQTETTAVQKAEAGQEWRPLSGTESLSINTFTESSSILEAFETTSSDGQGFDFARLRAEVKAWQAQEEITIQNASMHPEQTRLAMLKLLEKETQLLVALDNLSARVCEDARGRAMIDALKINTQPEKLPLKSGSTITVYKPEVLRALEVLSVFQRLALQPKSLSEREGILKQVLELTSALPGPGSSDLTALVNRELDLLRRGRREEMLTGLRKRICHLYVEVMKQSK